LPRAPKPAKLVVGVILKEKSLLPPVVHDLVAHFGSVDMVSPWYPFDFTDYYEAEMGRPLFRRMLSFARLVDPGRLPDIKRTTNALERRRSEAGLRRVNLDPGYLVHAQFVLATGKNYAHRIYIGSGIYADLTLMFHKGSFESLPWTYPDYADRRIQRFLLLVRKRYGYNLQERKEIR
jgi:hypothetical protein